MRRRSLLCAAPWSAALLAVVLSGCQSSTEAERPYVVLVSLDGFRNDYPEVHSAPNLLRIASEGVRSQGLIPSYRTNTFPNHTSIATGLYPAHHGIVDNNFYDRQRKQFYTYNQKETGGDGSWYGGTPIWVLAEQQGVRANTYYWPATDTEIQQTRPTVFFPYDSSVPASKRIDEVIQWMHAPKAERPHLVTLYFEHVDSAGHEYGPNAPETAQAVKEIDAEIGRLYDALKASDPPANLFIVGDHGMMEIGETVDLGTDADFPGALIAPRRGSQVMFYVDDPDELDRTYRRLKDRNDPRYSVYRRAEVPAYLHYSDSERIGDIVVISNTPDVLSISKPGESAWKPSPGAHGFDPVRFPQMQAIFIAAGPSFRSGLTLYPFENVNIYPLMADILQLKAPDNLDGSLTVLTGALR